MKEKTNKSGKKISDLCTVAIAASFITVCAWISIPFPISITMQTFAICAVCGILGLKRGFLSVLVYFCLGLVGLPVFSGFRGGISALADPSGGYLLGFLLLALTVGVASELFSKKTIVLACSMGVGMLLCYSCGSLWYYFLYAREATFMVVISTSVLPFVIPDILKIILASIIVKYANKSTWAKRL